jgi:hypothetical protein
MNGLSFEDRSIGEHLHHADQCSDLSRKLGTITDCAVDLLSFIKMR